MSKLESLLEHSNELPSLPEIYIRVSRLLESDDSDAYQIGQAIQTDPSLTAKVLKIVNSAYFGLPNQVMSISQAISLLGRQQIKQILMGSVLVGVFDEVNNADFSMLDFWQHSIKTAIIARHLAMQNAQIIDHEAFFTAGLLHDIGRLVIAIVATDILVEINDHVNADGVDILQAEFDQLGLTHVDLGGALMKKWDMPSLLTQCVIKHHEVDHVGPFAIDTSMVYLANKLSKKPLAEDDDKMQKILAKIDNWQQTGCTLEQIYAACRLADDQCFEVMVSLGMAEWDSLDDSY